jgi:hypothetical protein
VSVFFINPFLGAVGGDYESIATTTITASGGAGSVTFSSIPSTYQHLQIRATARTSNSDSFGTEFQVIFNDYANSTSNYAAHRLWGSGASAGASGFSSQNNATVWSASNAIHNTSVFASFVIDILDYASTSKATTIRAFGGYDNNGSTNPGYVNLSSGLWISTSAVNEVIFNNSGTTKFVQNSTFALYGIKAP